MSSVIKLKDRIKFWKDQNLPIRCAKCKAIGRESLITADCGGYPCNIDIILSERKHAHATVEAKLEKLKTGEKVEL